MMIFNAKSFGGIRVGLVVWLLALGGLFDAAKLNAIDTGVKDPADNGTAVPLSASQEAIEMRYRRFEDSLIQLREYLRKTDPSRAELLARATGKSNENQLRKQLKDLTELIKKDQLSDAAEQQETLIAEFQSLLELLLSEARKDELELEKKRIQDAIKEVTKLIGKETDARAATERGGKTEELQSRQQQVTDSTKKLIEKMESHDAAKNANKKEQQSDSIEKKDSSKPNESSPDDKPANEQQKPEGKEGDSSPESKNQSSEDKEARPDEKQEQQSPEKNSDQKPDDGEPKSGEPKPAESNKPDESPKDKPQSQKPQPSKSQPNKPKPSKPKKDKPQPGAPQENQENQEQQQDDQDQESPENESPEQDGPQKKPQDKTPGREELKRALREMDRAIEDLKKNSKKSASDKQDKAIAELMKAKEKLEEILRQLREEEREIVLVQMETRFRDLLQKQEAIYNATLAVHAVPTDSRTDRHRNRSVELARTEDEIALLAAKALTLLKEEGSSVAFPEAVEQIRDDMVTIARRLERVDVGEITQNIEQDTIESLKEIIEAMQKEVEKLKDKKEQEKDQKKEQQSQQQQKNLINDLAELKMLRSLQYRVNRRTKQVGRLVDGEQASEADIVSQLKQLSDRQAKLQKATYDLSIGKNQ